MSNAQDFITQLNGIISENLSNENFSVEQLSESMHMCRMSLYRKTMDVFRQPPSALIREKRLEKGKRLLMETDLSIAQISYKIGLQDPNYFSRIFSQDFGISPTSFRKQSGNDH